MQTMLAVLWHSQRIASLRYMTDIAAQIGPDLLAMQLPGKGPADIDSCEPPQPQNARYLNTIAGFPWPEPRLPIPAGYHMGTARDQTHATLRHRRAS